MLHFAAPVIEEMEKTETNVVFLKVDVDVNEEGAEAYNVTAMPTFIFIQNGVKVPLHTELFQNSLQR